VAEKIESSILQASRKTVAENKGDDPSHVTACIEGSWQKYCHNSLIDIISATFFNSEEVLGTEIMGRLCFVCHTNPTSEHMCKRNCEGTGVGREVTAVLSIFSRSLHNQSIYYLKYLGDWGGEAYRRVFAGKPYGPNMSVKRLECIVRVQKRVGTSLRRHMKEKIGAKLHDGKHLGCRY
jgi:hypothetical protein